MGTADEDIGTTHENGAKDHEKDANDPQINSEYVTLGMADEERK